MLTSPLCVGACGALKRPACTNTQNQRDRAADARAGALTSPQGNESKTHL
ncbi:hypothetical protein KDAU_53380 [Dictyobacter aurantiacus]|uniref:Uncharacterized protein n=1 Tax=Dictyobacter aurantiacus TaxID=1936993 RepID=A0A401ZMB0_9CHLR|nr:hypothetical protein KDAU_53380 [Dictyobacter aurantiacus]